MNQIYRFGIYLFLIVSALCCVLPAFATTAPHFSGGRTQTMNACENSNPHSIDSLLTITDPDVGQTETWTLISGPTHGSVTPSTFSMSSTGGPLTPTGFNYAPFTAFVGNDTFKFRIFDGTFDDTTTVYITVNPLPHIGNIVGPNHLCVGDSIALMDTPSGYWISWYPNATVSISGVVVGISPGLDTILYHVSNICGVLETAWAITINPSPGAGVITGPDSACIGTVFSLFETSSTGAWSTSNPADTVIFGVVQALEVGIDTIYYTASNAYCTMRAVHPITIDPVPHVSAISGSSVICEGSSYTLTDTASGGMWFSTTGNVTMSYWGVATGITPGADTISYIYTDACGTASTSYPVTVNPLPANSPVIGDSLTCVGASLTFYDSTTGGVWSSSNIGVAAPSGGGGIIAVGTGSAIISYTTTNSCGIIVEAVVLHVNGVPVMGPIAGSAMLCFGTTTVFTDTLSGGIWQSSNSTGYFVDTVFYAANVGTDTIIYSYANNCGADTVLFPVTVNPLPMAGVISGVNSICPKDTAFLFDNTTGGIWAFTDTLFAGISSTSGDTVTFYGVAPGTAVFYYTVTNVCGTATATFSVAIGNLVVCPSEVKPIEGQLTGLSVFPNPNNGTFVLRFDDLSGGTAPVTAQVFDVTGRLTHEFQLIPGTATEFASDLQSGIYSISVRAANGNWVTKLVVTK